jgi:hypothetical protein
MLIFITFLCCLQLPWRTHLHQRLPLTSLQAIGGVLSQGNIPSPLQRCLPPSFMHLAGCWQCIAPSTRMPHPHPAILPPSIGVCAGRSM